MAIIKVGLVQQSCSEDRADNMAKTVAGVAEAAAQGANLICLQELHAGVYFCQREEDRRFDEAESIPGPTTDTYAALAKEHGVVIVTSIFEKRAAGLYHNTIAVMDKDGSIAGTYRKSHIPDDPGYYEKFFFTPGDTGFHPIETSVGKLGCLICWDQWYPEAARLMALAGAEILIYPTAIGCKPEEPKDEHDRQLTAWQTVQRGHAVANCIPVVAINRVGFEPSPESDRDGMNFWGRSFVAGCQGEMLAEASGDQEEVLLVELDTGHIDKVRRAWPFFRDRRIDLYGDLLKRYRD